MVLWQKNAHSYPYDFNAVSLAFFNRYPNPYANHVRSIDTLSREIDHEGNLRSVRLIKKTGKMPRWVKPVLGGISDSWIIEYSVVDSARQTLKTYTKNLDHTKILQIEEYTDYEYDFNNSSTKVNSRVKFTSAFHLGIKDRIENWSRSKFEENINKSRLGMSFVMQRTQTRDRLN
ncbi:hypothetical protein Kpol_530p22 [Vanderwaltozyma polyspora DSM 70294]|uniref:PRELI/MSF1 domain-containing protein n=1 Tax=Vanderwaltozyma polyspora (strain ATCC 22028 / DSM 70294 / BCRC 21397 / CBS 2163 / NBRC 10782 / NRRL Y-8283 / UCD 57-17) TaxID=436907 RepID=A7TKZ6_VANPO|nr:uncharacterized protein Kpol_530p22 [Vanderwaltozyma polyspora DSM 70294]EDO17052.1 hypothetical protein Kpol_530p22 [Vanderwaltozyma polyspora DSM 70294]